MIADSDLERARSRFDLVTADVAMKHKGRELVGLCPFHPEKTPSFYVVPEKGFFHCYGCGAHGTAIDYIMRVRGLGFIEAVTEILGLPPQRAREAAPQLKSVRPGGQPQDDDDARRIREILAGCVPATLSTPAGIYLQMRGLHPIDHSRAEPWPGLLAHPDLYCHEIRASLPALVAPISNRDGVITALMRVWVERKNGLDGAPSTRANRPDITVRKKGLGTMGDGAVQLWPAASQMGFAEGVETALAAKRLYRTRVWAACGTARFGYPAHLRETRPAPGERARVWFPPDRPPPDVACHQVAERAPSLWVPSCVEQLFIYGDNGFAGEISANHAADWFTRHGLPTAAVFPAAGFGDFNDQLLGVAS